MRRGEHGTNYRGPYSEYVARVFILIRSDNPPLLRKADPPIFFFFSPWPETALGGPAGSVFLRNIGTVLLVKGNLS